MWQQVFSDGFFETGLQPWDVAAGSLLVQEAGGLVGNFTGEADFCTQTMRDGQSKIYSQMVQMLKTYSQTCSGVNRDIFSLKSAGLANSVAIEKGRLTNRPFVCKGELIVRNSVRKPAR